MITLNWKPYNVLGAKYYYTFYKEKFWCIPAQHVNNGIADDEFIFQVTTSKMDEKTKNGLIQRLIDLFPELNLEQIKRALHYDKDTTLHAD